jgi:hypothetical protein
MAWRMEGWKGLTPYWWFINFGTKGGRANSGAYPAYGPTHFVTRATRKAQTAFNRALADVEMEEERIVTETVDDFVTNPESYRQYDVLEEFYAQGRPYVVYVTKTKKLGVSTVKTYRGLRG